MRDALAKANVARNHILDIMYQAIPEPRKDLCEYAPRITAIRIDKEKIREIIGPGGKIVRDIQETTAPPSSSRTTAPCRSGGNKSQPRRGPQAHQRHHRGAGTGRDLRCKSQVHRGLRRVRGIFCPQGRARAHFRARLNASTAPKTWSRWATSYASSSSLRPLRQGQAEQKKR